MEDVPDDALMERLKSHAKVFDGLMSLIPAKLYYGEDVSDQWKKKKQTKKEAREAKLAKLDPDSFKSAKDVQDERAQKRKREAEEEDVLDVDDGMEKPLEGMKRPKKKARSSKQSTTNESKAAKATTDNDEVIEAGSKAKEKKPKKSKKERKTERELEREKISPPKNITHQDQQSADAATDTLSQQMNGTADAIAEPEALEAPDSSKGSPELLSPTFDTLHTGSASSSSSSVVPPATEEKFVKRNIPKVTTAELQERLSAKIAALRAKRKADDGSNARTRQELIESRRQKEQERRARKQEKRAKRREEEREQKEAALQASLRNSPVSFGSGSNGGSLLHSPVGIEQDNNFAFGRVNFEDGQRLDPSLSNVLDAPKTKGAVDAKTALQLAEAKQQRLNGLDEAKRADIEEKDRWLNANKRIHGEKIRDNTSLLKKTLKRKEKGKQKSESAWQTRLEVVEQGKQARQRKRDENLQKRKEDKGSKGKGGKKVGKKGTKVKSRPGFEGSFRSKSGGSKPKKS